MDLDEHRYRRGYFPTHWDEIEPWTPDVVAMWADAYENWPRCTKCNHPERLCICEEDRSDKREPRGLFDAGEAPQAPFEATDFEPAQTDAYTEKSSCANSYSVRSLLEDSIPF